MRILFDENTGSGVPKALRLVGFDNVNYITNMFRDEIEKGQGVADEQWIPRVGDQWLVISEDQDCSGSRGSVAQPHPALRHTRACRGYLAVSGTDASNDTLHTDQPRCRGGSERRFQQGA